MVKFANLIYLYNRNIVISVVLLAVSSLCALSLNAQVFQPSESTLVFPAQEEASRTGSVYQPFAPFTPYQQLGDTNPVLYGPGGDPIGGLPIANGAHLLFFCVIGYSIYKLFSQRKKR